MSTVYKTRKNEVIKAEIEVTKSMLLVAPSTKARNVVVSSEIRNARIMAMKRGLKDMVFGLSAVSYRLSPFI